MPSSAIDAGLALGLAGAPLLAYALGVLDAKVTLATSTITPSNEGGSNA